jgi:putative aldouronate transport system substrate-binding protein
MIHDYVFPKVLMTMDDTDALTYIQPDLISYINSSKSAFIRDGVTDDSWNEYVSQVEAYGLEEYLGIYQKYLDAYYAE